MNLKPITLQDVPAHETVCDVCDGDLFHIIVIGGHTHFICANSVCNELVCQMGTCKLETKKVCKKCGSPLTPYGKCTDLTCPHSDKFQDQCSYCGSGLIDGDCQKCGL